MTNALPRVLRPSRLPTMLGLVEAWTSSSASVRVTSFTPSLRSFSAYAFSTTWGSFSTTWGSPTAVGCSWAISMAAESSSV